MSAGKSLTLRSSRPATSRFAHFRGRLSLGVRPPEVKTGVTDRAAAPDRKIIYIVNTHGWDVMKIMLKSQEAGSAFTIGLAGMFETVALS